MRKIVMLILLMTAVYCSLMGQTPQLPWSTVSNGGAFAISGALGLNSSIGQSIASNPLVAGGLSLEGGYIPGLRVFAGSTAAFAQQAASGWNMVSVPLVVSDYHKSTLYPSASSNAYYYSGGYAVATTLTNGTGYWLQYASTSPVALSGTAFPAETLQVLQNWNMVGPPSYPLLRTSVQSVGTTVQSHFFGYKSGSGYLSADTLYPGNAYWVQVSANGSLILQSGGVTQTPIPPSTLSQSGGIKNPLLSAEQAEEVKNFNLLTFRDASGTERMLYYSGSPSKIDLSTYTLPPVAPDNLMDVRFASERIVEVAPHSATSVNFPIRLSGGLYPITITWSGKGGKSNDHLILLDAQGGKRDHLLSSTGQLTIDNPESASGIRLQIASVSVNAIPKEFALYQNYPNPFNPSTMVRYDLPKSSHVYLRVFNILGEEVSTLVDGNQDAGSYEVRLNAERFPSGIYFYRLEAGNVVFTKKLVLMK